MAIRSNSSHSWSGLQASSTGWNGTILFPILRNWHWQAQPGNPSHCSHRSHCLWRHADRKGLSLTLEMVEVVSTLMLISSSFLLSHIQGFSSCLLASAHADEHGFPMIHRTPSESSGVMFCCDVQFIDWSNSFTSIRSNAGPLSLGSYHDNIVVNMLQSQDWTWMLFSTLLATR